MPLRLIWKPRALRQLEAAADWSAREATAVVDTMERMARLGWSLGRPAGRHGRRYLPVPPLGVLYRVRGTDLIVDAIIDVRRLRSRLP